MSGGVGGLWAGFEVCVVLGEYQTVVAAPSIGGHVRLPQRLTLRAVIRLEALPVIEISRCKVVALDDNGIVRLRADAGGCPIGTARKDRARLARAIDVQAELVVGDVIFADHAVGDFDARTVKRLPRWFVLSVVDACIAEYQVQVTLRLDETLQELRVVELVKRSVAVAAFVGGAVKQHGHAFKNLSGKHYPKRVAGLIDTVVKDRRVRATAFSL